MDGPPAVPTEVQRKVDALGAAGHRWLDELAATIDELVAEWRIASVGSVLAGGSAALVVEVEAGDGRPAVLKLAMPDGLEGNGEHDRELAAVTAGQGHGYVDLLAVDPGRRAVLMERLGSPVADLDLDAEARIDRIAATVRRSWSAPLPAAIARTGADQAAFLESFIVDRWCRLDRSCPEAVVDDAVRCVRSRGESFDARRAVLVHGDAHEANVLEDPGAPGTFKLIDPDAMRSEPAHDLGIVLRDQDDLLLAASSPVAVLRTRCERLAGACDADVEPEAVWEWAFAERVSTGLFLLELGDPSGRTYLDVATAFLDG